MAAEAGAQIINVSGGEFSPSGTAHPILADAVREVRGSRISDRGCRRESGLPLSAYSRGDPFRAGGRSHGPDGEPYAYSNWGYGTQGILAPVVGEGTSDYSGTSFAAPIVSGIVGLCLSLQFQRGLHPSAEMVRDAMLSSAEGCEDQSVDICDQLLAGRLVISATLKLMIQGVAPMSGPQSVNADNRNSVSGDHTSPANTAETAATGQVENQAGVGFSSGSPSYQTPFGSSSCHDFPIPDGIVARKRSGSYIEYPSSFSFSPPRPHLMQEWSHPHPAVAGMGKPPEGLRSRQALLRLRYYVSKVVLRRQHVEVFLPATTRTSTQCEYR